MIHDEDRIEREMRQTDYYLAVTSAIAVAIVVIWIGLFWFEAAK